MSFSHEDVVKIAHLARLELEDDSIPQLKSNLSNIMSLIATINEADTQAISPMAHSFETLSQRLREDKVTEYPDRSVFQAIAPQTEAGLYLVPKVIEEKEG